MLKTLYLNFLFVFFLALFSGVQAQDIIGKVADIETKQPISRANVEIWEQYHFINRVKSDSLGRYLFSLDRVKNGSEIRVNCTGYESRVIPFKANELKINRQKELVFELIELKRNAILLDEVVIKRDKRYSDTASIDLSKEKFERSYMIGDLLSGSNGFYKDNKGRLFYKGKPVADIILNGGEFFGTNNLSIYNNLPALVLEGIQVMETNIDSVTNITMIRPTVKVNLILKDKYRNGKFGNSNLGAGTQKRYVANSDLYQYRNKEQFSINFNLNNINVGDNTLSEPSPSFSPNGNNSKLSSSGIIYRNLFFKGKIDFNFSIKGKVNWSFLSSEEERKDINLNQTSSTFTLSKAKALNLEGSGLNIKYQLGPLSYIKLSQLLGYNKTNQQDSLRFAIDLNGSLTISDIQKDRDLFLIKTISNLSYQKMFSSKKGRVLNINFILDKVRQQNNEENSILDFLNNDLKKSTLFGSRFLIEKKNTFNVDFIEPNSTSSYIKYHLSYKDDRIKFSEKVTGSILQSFKDNDIILDYHFVKSGLDFKKILDKVSLEGSITGILTYKSAAINEERYSNNFINADADFNIDYKLDAIRNITGRYSLVTNFPNKDQLTSMNNSFSPISQIENNPNLKPEINNKVEFVCDLNKTDSSLLSLNGTFNFYRSKFGFNIISIPNKGQSSFIDNIGNSFASDLALSLSSRLKNRNNINYQLNLSYREAPTIIDAQTKFNKGIGFNQTVSTNVSWLKGKLTSIPVISIILSRNYYDFERNDMINFIYTDKISVDIKKFQIAVYPLLNYSHSFNSNFSFALNGEVKRSFLKNYGSYWIKAYDLFKSFKYANNIIGDSYIQTVRFSNIQQYFLFGISLKFNNMH